VAAWHASLRIAREALDAANRRLPEDQRIQVLVNNSDGRGNSYGSHLNFLVARRAWENLFHRRIHYLGFLAAYQVSSILFTGQGKVGSENGRPPVGFQISQRADFIESLTGSQTTFRRPIVNSRDEALCGGHGRRGTEDAMARLHVIFYDSNLAHTACYLKVGVLQILLAMIEQDCVNPDLILEDPVDAVVRWSHDTTLRARARTLGGRRLTALELQLCFLEEAKKFVDRGACDGLVPECDRIFALWQDTLHKFASEDEDALARRLDWMLKLKVLEGVMSQRPELRWDSPQIKVLDQIYGSLALDEGLFWQYERDGLVDRLVSEERIERFVDSPPANTRAWTRSMLLRRGDAEMDRVDWDEVRFRWPHGVHSDRYRTVSLDNPLRYTRDETDALFRDHESLEDLLDALGATEELSRTRSTTQGWSSGGVTVWRGWTHG